MRGEEQMQFTFQAKTKVFFGEDCLSANKASLAQLGSRALIVTGKTSGAASGALSDLEKILDDLGGAWALFDAVENNPSLDTVAAGAALAAAFSPDFIVGIGGGSPLDAAKAIAVLAVNDIRPVDLFNNQFTNTPLPVAAIPTTAGTGSEVTPYAILTRDDLQTKKSFGNELTFPAFAFLDAKYTASMPEEVAVHTAVDAFSHALEGFLNKRSTSMSDMISVASMGVFGECIPSLRARLFDKDTRERLLYMSMLAGIVISQTGTTSVHSMGYCLTYFKSVPHGKANGLLLGEYLKKSKPLLEIKSTALCPYFNCRIWTRSACLWMNCFRPLSRSRGRRRNCMRRTLRFRKIWPQT